MSMPRLKGSCCHSELVDERMSSSSDLGSSNRNISRLHLTRCILSEYKPSFLLPLDKDSSYFQVQGRVVSPVTCHILRDYIQLVLHSTSRWLMAIHLQDLDLHSYVSNLSKRFRPSDIFSKISISWRLGLYLLWTSSN